MVDALADGFGALAVRTAAQLVVGERGDLHDDIDPVHERAGELGVVGADGLFAAPAAAARLSVPAAFARVHRAHEHEPAGVYRGSGGARDGHDAVLERLAHDFKHIPVVFGQLVEKQHAVVRKRDFARLRIGAAADQTDGRQRMVRRAERAVDDQRCIGREHPCDGMDLGCLDRLVKIHLGQNGRKPLCQHGFARAGRTDQQDVVPAGCRDLQRALGKLLPLDVRKVKREGFAPARENRLVKDERRDRRLTAQVAHQLHEVVHRIDADIRNR